MFRRSRISSAILIATIGISLLAIDAEAGQRRSQPKPAPLLQTGQTRCYDGVGVEIDCRGTGQDGDIRAGVAPDRVDNGDGTITDRTTGLMWEKMSDDNSIHDRDATYTFLGSKAAELNAVEFAGHADWRVPNARELESIRDYGHGRDTVASIFLRGCRKGCTVTSCSCTYRDFHWSSTSSVRDPFDAWLVGFRFGREFLLGKFSSYSTRAVRRDSSVVPRARLLKTGQRDCFDIVPPYYDPVQIPCVGTGQDGEFHSGASRSFVDNGDGTITDRVAGLMWEKLGRDGSIHDVSAFYTWIEAFSVKISALNAAAFAGHSDWRVPNLRELASLRNYGSFGPATYRVFDRDCEEGCSNIGCSCSVSEPWSSTSFARFPASAWSIDFAHSGVAFPTLPKSVQRPVRAVRGE